mgnify:CR=1 FL=1
MEEPGSGTGTRIPPRLWEKVVTVVVLTLLTPVLVFAGIVAGADLWQRATFVPTDAYFERAMNERLAGYRKMAGRTLRCSTEKMPRDQGFTVTCQYFRGEVGEEFTGAWYGPYGYFISSLDGG